MNSPFRSHIGIPHFQARRSNPARKLCWMEPPCAQSSFLCVRPASRGLRDCGALSQSRTWLQRLQTPAFSGGKAKAGASNDSLKSFVLDLQRAWAVLRLGGVISSIPAQNLSPCLLMFKNPHIEMLTSCMMVGLLEVTGTWQQYLCEKG